MMAQKRLLSFPCLVFFSFIFLPGLWAQTHNAYKTLTTASNTIVFDTVSGIGLDLNLSNPQPKHGQVSLAILTPGGSNTPYVYKLNYQPDPGFIGVDTFVLEYRYANSAPFLEYRGFRVLVKPSIVKAHTDYLTVHSGSDLVIEPLLNDSGLNGPLTLQGNPVTNFGTAYLLDQQRIHFTPNPGFIGVAHLNYVVCDALQTCETGVIHIGVHDGAPDTETLQVYTSKDKPVQIPLNFAVADIVEPPTHGSVALNASNNLVYTPQPAFSGQDQIIIKFSQNSVNYYKLISVKVYPSNKQNFMAVDDVVYTPVNTPVTFNVRSNDIGNLQVRQWTPTPGFPGTLSGTNGNGTVTFTPNPNFTGVATFQYKIGSVMQPVVETATVQVIVDNLAIPVKLPYRISAVSGIPLVLEYDIPYRPFSFEILDQPEHGNLTLYPGQTTQMVEGQSVSGYNLIVYRPDAGYAGLDQAVILYCAPNGQCQVSKLKLNVLPFTGQSPDCYQACVWPGDTDADGVVSSKDLLPFGFEIGAFGPSRAQTNTEWHGHAADNWDTQFSNITQNRKHLDTDGNGALNEADVIEIRENFNIVHNFIKPSVKTGKGLPFTLNVLNPQIVLGEPIYIEVGLGTDQVPALDITGFTFDLILAPDLVDSIFEMRFLEQSWLNRNAPFLTLSQRKSLGKFEVGFTRTNGQPTHGQGLIGIAELVIIDIVDVGGQDGRGVITLNPTVELSDGSTLLCDPVELQLPVRSLNRSKLDQQYHAGLQIFPSPATNYVFMEWKRSEAQDNASVLIRDVHGNTVFQAENLSGNTFTVPLENMPSGVYFLQFQSGTSFETKKFEVFKH